MLKKARNLFRFFLYKGKKVVIYIIYYNLAKIFKVDVTVEQSVLDRYLEEESGGQISSSSSSLLLGKTSASSSQQLKNIKIARTNFVASEAVYYALAVLNRRETAALYQKEIHDNQLKIKDYYQQYLDSDHKLRRLSFLYKTINLSNITNLLNDQYRIIAMSDGWGPVISDAQLDTDLSVELANISVSIVTEDQTNPEIDSYIKETIGKVGFLSGSESADFSCEYSFGYENTNINRENMVALNWHISINFRDSSTKTVLFVFNKEKRTVAVSEGELNSKMMRTVHKEITTNFYKQIIKYLNSM